MKKLLFILCFLLPLVGLTQINEYSAKRIRATDSMYVNGRWIIKITTNLNSPDSNSQNMLPTNRAVLDAIRAFGGGGSAQNLQQVTDAGSTTTNAITAPELKSAIGDDLQLTGAPSSNIRFNTNSTTRMSIKDDGTIDIGNPSTPFGVAQVNVGGIVQSNDAFVLSGSGVNAEFGISGITAFLRTFSPHPITFRTNDNERMRISATGSLLVNTTGGANISNRGAYFNTSIGANKDSLTSLASMANLSLVAMDTTTGRFHRYSLTGTAANEGASIAGGNVQLGQAIGEPGDPAAITTPREIPIGNNYLAIKNATHSAYLSAGGISIQAADGFGAISIGSIAAQGDSANGNPTTIMLSDQTGSQTSLRGYPTKAVLQMGYTHQFFVSGNVKLGGGDEHDNGHKLTSEGDLYVKDSAKIGDVSPGTTTDEVLVWGPDSVVRRVARSSIAAANEGASVAGGAVQLGQPIDEPGDPAEMTTNREIPMGFNYLLLKGGGYLHTLSSSGFTIGHEDNLVGTSVGPAQINLTGDTSLGHTAEIVLADQTGGATAIRGYTNRGVFEIGSAAHTFFHSGNVKLGGGDFNDNGHRVTIGGDLYIKDSVIIGDVSAGTNTDDVLVMGADSVVRKVLRSSFSGGTTLYSGNGSLAADREVAGNNKSLKLGTTPSHITRLDIQADSFYLSTTSGPIFLSGAIALPVTTFNGAFNVGITSTVNELAVLSTPRTVNFSSLASFANYNHIVEIVNKNNTDNLWTFATTVLDLYGNTITEVPNEAVSTYYFNGTNWILKTVSNRAIYNTSATSITLHQFDADYYYNGSVPATATLPPIANNLGRKILVSNVGSDIVTLNTNTGGNELYLAGSIGNTFNISPGQAYVFTNNGTYYILGF